MSEIFTKRTFCIFTFGCQMNVHDSEKITGIFKDKGFDYTEDPLKADIVVFNTCSVRLKAEEKFYTALGKLRKSKEKNKNKKIIVAGCTAQASAEEIIRRAPFVDLIIGPRSIDKIIDDIFISKGKTIVDADIARDVFSESIYDSLTDIYDRPSPVRAYVTIMEGCNNFCAYCIVPYTRGRELYRGKKQILNEIAQLADKGYLEVILLGQNVNVYKSDSYNFSDLLSDIARVGGIKRIRFVTSHPFFLDNRTIQVMSEHENICPQLHLPLQSGSDVILERMKRKYTYEKYMDRVHMLKYYIKNISLSSDFIVGFPGETEEDFSYTMNALKEVEYDQIFSFIYSPRPFTPAAKMNEEIPLEIKKNRLQELQGLQRKIQFKRNKADVGKKFSVLVDGPSKKDRSMLSGRTVSNKIVNFSGGADYMNKIVELKITEAAQNSLKGRLI